MTKKLALKKQTIDNLNRGEMHDLKAGLVIEPGCHFPTIRYLECDTIPGTVWTCGGATCMCMSVWPLQ
jgi:hypothetical protein